MRIVSLFAGIGGLDLAAEAAFGGRTTAQVDLVGHDVRARHWPGARQVVADVRTVRAADVGRADVLCGGFPCQDLSVANPNGAGLDGERSGLYSEVVRLAGDLRPDAVLLENVPKLLAYRDRVDEDFGRLGYGLTWVTIAAAHVGAPHIRRRVFVVGVRGGVGATVDAGPLPAVSPWPTPTAGLANYDESIASFDARRAVLEGKHKNGNGAGEPLGVAARRWPTPTATDHKGANAVGRRRGTLPEQIEPPVYASGGRLNPRWVETLMGLPVGWTLPDGPVLDALAVDRWPAGRVPDGPSPQYPWEPPRVVPTYRGRAVQLRALGNAVVWRQAAEAGRLATTGPVQVDLWGAS